MKKKNIIILVISILLIIGVSCYIVYRPKSVTNYIDIKVDDIEEIRLKNNNESTQEDESYYKIPGSQYKDMYQKLNGFVVDPYCTWFGLYVLKMDSSEKIEIYTKNEMYLIGDFYLVKYKIESDGDLNRTKSVNYTSNSSLNDIYNYFNY